MSDLFLADETVPSSFDEEAVELAALSWFELMGWSTVAGNQLAPHGQMGARSGYKQAVLEPELRSALATLNPNYPPSIIDAAVRNVLAISSQNVFENNRIFHPMLGTGVPVEVKQGGNSRTITLRLVDRADANANRLLVANQFIIEGDHETIRLDLVVFVNGLPLAILELKSPADTQATIGKAYTQLQNYRTKVPEVFRFNQLLVISDGVQARIGSLMTGLDRFAPWRTINGSAVDDTDRSELEVMIRGVFEPRIFLDFIVDFIVFEILDGAIRSKKLAGYHQFYAVQKAVATTVEAAAIDGMRKGGVVWHTQGSGKSLTMLFFVRQLQLAKPLKNPTIVLITDRNDLDDQLFGTFNAHRSALRGMPLQAENAQQMRQLLSVDIGGLVFSTIQLFRGDEGHHPLLTPRSNVVVIVDEAHRTQYGFKRRFILKNNGMREEIGFAEYLRQALPKATFVGFTGTPIALGDRNTEGVFGQVVDTYEMTQSVADKATVPIHYAARLIKLHLHLSDEERTELDALGEEIVDGDKEASERAKSRLVRFEEVVGAPDRVEQIAADIVEHFQRRCEALAGGKGMIVAVSRKVAVKIYNQIALLKPDWVSSNPMDDKIGKLKVVITGRGNDEPQELQPHLRTNRRLKELAERFKSSESGFDLVIVRDMWLTGFDAPALHTLYVDKPMRGHGLIQAITRVNRVWGDKPGGLVVDYVGIGADLKAALVHYTPKDRTQFKIDPGEPVRQTLLWLESAQAHLEGTRWREFFSGSPALRLTILKQCLEHILATGKREDFLEAATRVEVAYALSAGDERVTAMSGELGLIAALRANLTKYTAGGGRSRDAVERDIRQLLSRAVMADGVLDIFKSTGLDQPDLSILSEEFLADVRRTKEPNLAVEMLRRLLSDEIRIRTRSNIVEASKLSERLENTLRRYHNRAVDSIQIIEELIRLAKDMAQARARGEELGLKPEEIAFYDALAENGSARELMAHEELRLLAQVLVKTVRSSERIDWTRKASVRAQMRIDIRKLLAKYGYPPNLQRDAVELVVRQAEAFASADG